MNANDRFSLSVDGPTTTICFQRPDLNDQVVDSLRFDLERTVDACGTDMLQLDLANVNYLTSLAIGLFLGVFRKAKARGKQLSLINVSPFPFEVLSITGIVRLMEIHPAQVDSCTV